jgi:hypothetical protein
MNLYFHCRTGLHGAVRSSAHGRLHQMYPREMTPTDTVLAWSFVRFAHWNSRCIWRAAKDNLIAAGSSSLLLCVMNAASCLCLLHFGILVSLPINRGTFNLEVWSSWPVYAAHRIWHVVHWRHRRAISRQYIFLVAISWVLGSSVIKCVCTCAYVHSWVAVARLNMSCSPLTLKWL